MKILILSLILSASIAGGQILVQWVPTAGTAEESDYNNSGQNPAPTVEGFGVSASPLDRVNQPQTTANSSANWPGRVANFAGVAGEVDFETGAYTEFTITPPAFDGSSISYDTISYSLVTYSTTSRISTPEGYTGIIRTSADDFSTSLAETTIADSPDGTGLFVFDVSSLEAVEEPVIFRIYFVANADLGPWCDLRAANGGLIVNGTVAGAREESITWQGDVSAVWETAGPDENWDSSDGLFQAGDSVTFDDSVDPAFAGTVTIAGAVAPVTVSFQNETVDYTVTGPFTANDFLKSGSGTTSLQLTANEFLVVNGPVEVEGGTLELLGNTDAFSGVESLVIRNDGTVRLAAGNAGVDSLVPITMEGGTLEINDEQVFTWPPENSDITLAAGTTNTFGGSGIFRPFGGRIVGEGNLVKTGPGLLSLNNIREGFSDLLTYTGTTTINEGTLSVNGVNTIASETYSVTGGASLILLPDLVPLENLPSTASVSLAEATFVVSENVETLAVLEMDSTTGRNILEVDSLGATLSIDSLSLVGTENFVQFSPPIQESGVFEVANVATLTAGTLGQNLSVLGLSPAVQVWNQDPASGLVTVTIDLAAEQETALIYTDESGMGEWSNGVLTDWTNGAAASRFFTNFTATFNDTAFGEGPLLAVDILEQVFPNEVVFSHSEANTYVLTGEAIAGIGGLEVNGGGVLELNSTHLYEGDTLIAGESTLVLSAAFDAISRESEVIVEAGSLLEIGATNALQRVVNNAQVSIDGGSLVQTAGNHLQLADLVLSNGASWTSTTTGDFMGESARQNGDIFVEGTAPSSIGPFPGNLALNGVIFFGIEDASGDSLPDLVMDVNLVDPASSETLGGLDKDFEGTLLLQGINTFSGGTFVIDGCLLFEGAFAVPDIGVNTEVASGAEFGPVAGSLPDDQLVTIADNVTWDGGSFVFYVPTGETATFAGDLTGGALEAGSVPILVKGGGTLDFSGATLPTSPTSNDGSTIIGLSVEVSTISLDSFVVETGTNTGQMVTLTFSSDGPVDLYASSDLVSWGEPLLTDLAPGAPVVLDDLSDERQFFIFVTAGVPFPFTE